VASYKQSAAGTIRRAVFQIGALGAAALLSVAASHTSSQLATTHPPPEQPHSPRDTAYVMARGLGPASALPSIAILLGFSAVVTVIAIRVFRWDEI
jgi:hypothetical protein